MATQTLQRKQKSQRISKAMNLGGGLSPYSGSWTWQQAAHLLRRAAFGPTYQEIKDSVQAGLEASLQKLFEPRPEPDLPINFGFKDDPEVPIGETWVGKPITPNVKGLVPARNGSLSAWTIGLMIDTPLNVLEKLILFWHNHLVVSNIFSPDAKYNYLKTLRKYALNDFRQMMKDITIDAAMLEYLNGNENTAKSPNENYAREVLELFTLGKGPIIAPGDYTNYTENDIQELARALTGWKVRRRRGTVYFNNREHDKGTKQLSAHFNNATISDMGEKEYERVIDIIFEQEEVSRFLCRQLYIWYVNYNITDEVEMDVIEPMAQILRDNDYNVEPALRALFASEHFYAECNMGVMAKSPMDYTFNVIRSGNLPSPDDILQKYTVWNAVGRALRLMEQMMFFLPSVAGWQAYYQEPVFYRYWLNSISLNLRKDFNYAAVTGKLRGRGLKKGYQLDLLDLISQFDSPENPDALISDLTALFVPFPLTDEQYAYLKSEVLLPGLPDYEWTEEYGAYLDDPGDKDKKEAVLGRLQAVIQVIFSMPENQLM